MSFANALGSIGAGYGTAMHYKPNKGYIHDYEGMYHADVARQNSADPYSGSDLGFSPNVMQAKTGEGIDESGAEYKQDLGALDRDVASGNMRPLSGAYARAKQRALEGHLARTSDIRRRNLILDAMQRRTDLATRTEAARSAYSGGTNVYNSYADQATRRRSQIYGGYGELVGSAADAYAGGAV
jgi:hypothetical protein